MQSSNSISNSPVLSLSPSFNSYSSSSKLAEIAARVVEEYRNESDVSELDDDVFGLQNFNKSIQQQSNDDDDHDDDEDDEFEFPSLCEAPTSPISADEIFYNGQIKPIYPIFDTNLLIAEFGNGISEVPSKPPARVPLRKLMSEDRDPPSCSSSEADDLDGVPDGTYCVWTPKASAVAADSPEKCRKSNSTGSSKRWKFRDLLHRSNSEGKETFLFLNTKKKEISAPEKSSTGAKVKVAVGGVEVVPVTAAQEAYYGRQRVVVPKEVDRRRSFLPYRQDLVGGFFSNVNGMSRNLHPF